MATATDKPVCFCYSPASVRSSLGGGGYRLVMGNSSVRPVYAHFEIGTICVNRFRGNRGMSVRVLRGAGSRGRRGVFISALSGTTFRNTCSTLSSNDGYRLGMDKDEIFNACRASGSSGIVLALPCARN